MKLEDVAGEAGVSVMTVSRYINKSGYVGEKTAQKIQEALERLDYRPNLVAKSLVTKRTNTIGLIIASITNPFYPDLVLGVEDEANRQGYNVLLCNVEGRGSVTGIAKNLCEKCVDGIIFTHLSLTVEDLDWLRQRNVHCILIDNQTPCPGAFEVNSDDYAGAKMATEHLLALGHRDIALVHGELSQTPEEQAHRIHAMQYTIWINRTKGFMDAMAENGVPVDPAFVQLGDGSPQLGVEGGYNATMRLIAGERMPTAIFGENDLMCLGIYKALHSAGLRIPQDVSVIGYDGISMSDHCIPPLTTVMQRKYELGKAATQQMLRPIEEPKIIRLPPYLAVRSSTAAPHPTRLRSGGDPGGTSR